MKMNSPTKLENIAAAFLSALDSQVSGNDNPEVQIRISSVSIRRSRYTGKPVMNAQITGHIFMGHSEEREQIEAIREANAQRRLQRER